MRHHWRRWKKALRSHRFTAGYRPERRVTSGTPREDCEVRQILDRIADKWSLLAIALLEGRTLRFTELRREIDGISQRMLTVTLRQLERDGLVTRTVYPVVPPRVEYALTPLGATPARDDPGAGHLDRGAPGPRSPPRAPPTTRVRAAARRARSPRRRRRSPARSRERAKTTPATRPSAPMHRRAGVAGADAARELERRPARDAGAGRACADAGVDPAQDAAGTVPRAPSRRRTTWRGRRARGSGAAARGPGRRAARGRRARRGARPSPAGATAAGPRTTPGRRRRRARP